jgi:tricorn protease
MLHNKLNRLALLVFIIGAVTINTKAQGTRLLRQPTMSDNNIAFTYGADIWVTDLDGQNLKRITSTPAVENDPHFSPDGNWIAFTSNRSGSNSVYIVSKNGGTPKRLTWHPSPSVVRGWSTDGSQVLYASTRESAPTSINRLWTVSTNGGPSTRVTAQWGFDGSYSPNGRQMVIDKMSRWDTEWRHYRGGQNTPLIILNLTNNNEVFIPSESTTDIKPIWVGQNIYFLSDRDWIMNIWSYSTRTNELTQITNFTGSVVKSLDAGNGQLIFEREGYLHILDPSTGNSTQLEIDVVGDFPWAETKWENVGSRARSASLSPSGKRAVMESRGEIFTIPTEHGDSRNLTQSSNAADRAPIWSPKGDKIAWFSDNGGNGYALYMADQDGITGATSFSIGESKMAWEPTWSPDGSAIAFVDDDVRIRVINVESGNILTADVGGNNLERGRSGITWSPDSKFLAYSKNGDNNFRKIMVWSKDKNEVNQLTNSFADSFAPSFDRDGKHLYFLASTNVALGSSWANTSAMQADPNYAAYVIILNENGESPFIPRSDEEKVKEEKKEDNKDEGAEKDDKKEEKDEGVTIDVEGIERRTIALPLPNANYTTTEAGPKGAVFIGERKAGTFSLTLQKFTLEKRKSDEFLTGVRQFSVSADGKKMLVQKGSSWQVVNTSGVSGKGGKNFSVNIKMKLNRLEEWNQMFEEAWRYERDYFYDSDMHGRDWDVVYKRYAPLVPYIRHRADLNYVLDQVNGELSVGHSFVRGGDFPSTDRSNVGLLGADLEINSNRWQIKRIYTTESWNPRLTSPLDRPGMNVKEGYYLVGVNGKELTAATDPYEFLDGTLGVQTVLHFNDKPTFEGSWKETASPIRSENALRQRAWVEDNRRMVDQLSNGRLGYVWVPNTGGSGFVSFNRYFFAQQDKEGAVIDERFNGGGSLDDYMVDLMTRSLRAGLTNEVPNGKPLKLPAGILGPKVLLINEMAGSGGDFFPWAFRQQKAGPLIGAKTWGGLVKSSTHYALVDGGSLTAPDNAVFDPINNKWVAENEGIAPDIEVRQDAKSLSAGKDPQLEKAVEEVLRLIKEQGAIEIKYPSYSKPAIKKSGN